MNMKGLYKRGRKWQTHYRSNKHTVASVLYNHCLYFLFTQSCVSKKCPGFPRYISFSVHFDTLLLLRKKKRVYKGRFEFSIEGTEEKEKVHWRGE